MKSEICWQELEAFNQFIYFPHALVQLKFGCKDTIKLLAIQTSKGIIVITLYNYQEKCHETKKDKGEYKNKSGANPNIMFVSIHARFSLDSMVFYYGRTL